MRLWSNPKGETYMRLYSLGRGLLLVAIMLSPVAVLAAAITDFDSTQPRGASQEAKNSQGQVLAPIKQGFRAPTFRAKFDSENFFDWSGMLMGNAMRDPGYFAMHMSSIQDFMNYANSVPGDPSDPDSPIHQLLVKLKLEEDIKSRDNDGKLQSEKLLPVTADLCLRCHGNVGWLEAHSEPPSSAFPFLEGSFWATDFRNYPGWPENPHKVKLKKESEAEMDGVQCDFCHRAYTNFKRKSRFDGSTIPNGNGGFFVDRRNIFGLGAVEPAYDFQGRSVFCGTCHDVTNPLINTITVVDGKIPENMLHPIERTYTEWYWSGYRTQGTTCQDCHAPMKFLGAQTWNFLAMDELWGAIDAKWLKSPFEYNWVPSRRTEAFHAARERNLSFMKTAATVTLNDLPKTVRPGTTITPTVKIVNNAGHKLPTGYGEGRQMWISIEASDARGTVFYEDGILDSNGKLVRTSETKVYEYVALAENYDGNMVDGFNILDTNKDRSVSHLEKEFRFVLMNFIEKDNRIPPEGFVREGFQADGAFIVPRDPKDRDYRDGQNWDITPYSIRIPENAQGPITITATLRYQTFSHEFIHALNERDHQLTEKDDGPARNIPNGPYDELSTWGQVSEAVWQDHNKGCPVTIGTASVTMEVQETRKLKH